MDPILVDEIRLLIDSCQAWRWVRLRSTKMILVDLCLSAYIRSRPDVRLGMHAYMIIFANRSRREEEEGDTVVLGLNWSASRY